MSSNRRSYQTSALPSPQPHPISHADSGLMSASGKNTLELPPPNQQSATSILDSVLDGSIKVGAENVQDGSLTKLEPLKQGNDS